jgi:hypothetical protein
LVKTAGAQAGRLAHEAGISAGSPPRLIGRLRARSYQRGFVGKDHGLDAIAQAELGQHLADVDLHRAHGQVQAIGDFAVGHARGDEGEDVLLAAGQRAADLLGALAVGGLGLAMPWRCRRRAFRRVIGRS